MSSKRLNSSSRKKMMENTFTNRVKDVWNKLCRYVVRGYEIKIVLNGNEKKTGGERRRQATNFRDL